jgi:flagellin FlaB
VGIGTLIVFIALVLVAAIAAGVLINTAGFLQNQAESTGEESTQQVSNNLKVLSATGSMSGSAPVDQVTLTVGVGPGSDPIDLEDVNIQYLNDTATSFQGDDTTDTSIKFQNTDGSDPSSNIISSGEKLQIVFDLDATASSTTFGGGTLTEGEEAEVQLTTADGSQTTEILNVPDPLDGTDAVRL